MFNGDLPCRLIVEHFEGYCVVCKVGLQRSFRLRHTAHALTQGLPTQSTHASLLSAANSEGILKNREILSR